MHSHAKPAGKWGLRWLLRPRPKAAAEPVAPSTRVMHEARRNMLKKLSLHFAKEHCGS